jgi:hypothetical protein
MWIRDVTAQGKQQGGNGGLGPLNVDPGGGLLLKAETGKLINWVGVVVLPGGVLRGWHDCPF